MGLIESILALFRKPQAPAVTPVLPVPTEKPAQVIPETIPFSMTADVLMKATGVSTSLAQAWIGPLRSAMSSFQITQPARAAAFVAQVAHESGRFVWVKELWGPTTAQKGYEPPSAKANDLGNTQPGDGLRFCGRGLIQITGRANYAACSKALSIDFVASPSTLEQPIYAALSAAWFWQQHGLNELADNGDFLTITKRINGGTNGLAERQALWESCKQAMEVA